jgi:hypothetical protein
MAVLSQPLHPLERALGKALPGHGHERAGERTRQSQHRLGGGGECLAGEDESAGVVEIEPVGEGIIVRQFVGVDAALLGCVLIEIVQETGEDRTPCRRTTSRTSPRGPAPDAAEVPSGRGSRTRRALSIDSPAASGFGPSMGRPTV